MEPRDDEFQLARRGSAREGSEPGGPMGFERPMDGDVMIAMAESFGWRFVAPDAVFISVGTLRKVTLALSVAQRCVPLVFRPRRAVVLVDDPLNGLALQANPQWLGPPYERDVEVILTTSPVIDALLEKRRTVVED